MNLMPTIDQVPVESLRNYNLILHVLRELSRYMTELAVCLGGECSRHKPSHLAMAVLQVSMNLLTTRALPHLVRNNFRQDAVRSCRWTPTDLDSITRLERLIQ